MIKFAKTTPVPKSKSTESIQIAYFYAGVLVVLAFCQLFNFDEFLELLATMNLPGGDGTAYLFGSLIVIFEVFALPFLLRLRLSPAMRVASMICGWLVPLGWLKLSVWTVFMTDNISNLGLMGTLVDLTPGLWSIFIAIALGALAAWASWGLWPIDSKLKTS